MKVGQGCLVWRGHDEFCDGRMKLDVEINERLLGRLGE
jgi:hypothetical protein